MSIIEDINEVIIEFEKINSKDDSVQNIILHLQNIKFKIHHFEITIKSLLNEIDQQFKQYEFCRKTV